MLYAFEIAGDALTMKDKKQRDPRDRHDPPETVELVEEDPSAKFAYELATSPPIKDVASVKAASDIFDANPKDPSSKKAPSRPKSTDD